MLMTCLVSLMTAIFQMMKPSGFPQVSEWPSCILITGVFDDSSFSLHQWFSKSGPQTSSISFTRELVLNTNSWAPFNLLKQNSGGGVQQPVSQALPVILTCDQMREPRAYLMSTTCIQLRLILGAESI